MQVPVQLIPISPPPVEARVRRAARFAPEGEKRSRYSLPIGLESSSPVGYRTRIALSQEQSTEAAQLLSLTRPAEYVPSASPTEQELFEESSLGVLSSRQSTNFRGFRQVTLGPEDSKTLAPVLRELDHLESIPDEQIDVGQYRVQGLAEVLADVGRSQVQHEHFRLALTSTRGHVLPDPLDGLDPTFMRQKKTVRHDDRTLLQ